MVSDKRQKASPPPPNPLELEQVQVSSFTSRGAIPKPTGLRVRPKPFKSGIARRATSHPQRQLRDECYSALLPVLLIATVWCFGCYLYLWISLYKSFNTDTDDRSIVFHKHKRKDIMAIQLEQFLAGSAAENYADEHDNAEDNNVKGGWSNNALPVSHHNNTNSSLLEQIGNPIIAKQIQSTLISRTGFPNLVLGAYLEPPLPLEEVNGNSLMKLRDHTPQNLTYISYPYQQHMQAKNNQPKDLMPGACSQKGAQWIFPTFHPKSLDHYFESNVHKKHPIFDKRWELAMGMKGNGGNKGHCPVDADPYLPWIHDAFPSNDGIHIEFIIHNKRRCNTDPNIFHSDLKNLEPQVALMQPIPVKRIQEGMSELSDTLKKLWAPNSNGKQSIDQSESFLLEDETYNPPRYTLAASLDDADKDGMYTRFICRFHTIIIEEGGDKTRLKKMVLGETFSSYPYNPEHVNYRKRNSKPMLTSLDKGHDEQLWNSVYSARCPVPHFRDKVGNTSSNALGNIIASGKSVFDGTPSLYVDLIPIRTPARTNLEGFALPGVKQSTFDPKLVWGNAHVIPRIEASGRWINIPICHTPKVDESLAVEDAEQDESLAAEDAEQAKTSESNGITDTSHGNAQNKTHFLVACVWASQSFSTRGQTSDTDSSTSARLREFLTYHLHVAGFSHVYVYDNSDSEASDTLSPVTDLFSPTNVTRIPWPHRVCNNNRPMHANPGERSSQYAAENSCRARYGPDTTWMASLDVDEYLIPTGKQWINLRHWLEHITSQEDSTKILSFYQTRALPDVESMVPYDGVDTSSCKVEGSRGLLESMCAMKDPNKTFMETYNCEPTTHPKPQSWAWRAKKQIYRPDFVLNHFVHYPIITTRILDKPLETSPRFAERAPFERRVNELTEGFLLHTKTTVPDWTSKWHETCPLKGIGTEKKSSCKVGIPSPDILLGEESNLLARGAGDGPSNAYESNCYRHIRVMNEWVPKLEDALQSLDYM